MIRRVIACLCAVSFVVIAAGASAQTTTPYTQTNLVSDIPGMAPVTDAHLINPWGIAASATGPFWVANNGDSVSTVYDGAGQPFPVGAPLVVTIPPPRNRAANAPSAPIGIVFNGTSDFVVSQNNLSGPSQFLFATEGGTISGWNPTVNRTTAVLTVDNSAGGAGAVYKGLASGTNSAGNFLYATNFRAGTVDVFDRTFKLARLTGTFADPNLPVGFAPFGIQNLNGSIFVTYAKQNAAKNGDVAGAGNGVVDVFDTDGRFVRRLASGGTLNSPWGLVTTTASFGTFSNDLLVGNFGDGRINAYNLSNSAYLGQLQSTTGNPLAIPGLWGLLFGNGTNGAGVNTLYFTAGIQQEKHGLFGSLTPILGATTPVPVTSTAAAVTQTVVAGATANPAGQSGTGSASVPMVPILLVGLILAGTGILMYRRRTQ